MQNPFNHISVAILAGGLGTRLRSVVADRPKVLAPVAGRPFVTYLLDQLAAVGVRKTTLLAGYAGEQLRAAIGNRYARMEIGYSIEPEPLGTAGAVRYAMPSLPEQTILLLNGDSYCDLDLLAFCHHHFEHSGAASMVLTQVLDASRFGTVKLTDNDLIAGFQEKNQFTGPAWINAGLYLFDRAVIERIEPGQAISLEGEVLPACVASGCLQGFRAGNRFIDIGVPESYVAAERFFAELGRLRTNELSQRKKSACLILPGRCELTFASPRIRDFLQAGWAVHVLACGEIDAHCARKLATAGVELTSLDHCDMPREYRVAEMYGDRTAELSDQVRIALEKLHGKQRFGLIEFAGKYGLGTRSIQAKRAGLAFRDTVLAVSLDGNSQFEREKQQRWPSGFADVELDYSERFAFENADVQRLSDSTLAKFVRGIGWEIRSDAIKAVAEHSLGPSPADEITKQYPLVTVGISHYNLGRYLPDALASIAAQSYRNLEVIAIDDGSTDADSLAAFESQRDRYPMFRFIRQANAGVAVARNHCLALANGEYFVSVDADNLAHPEMIAHFVTAIERNADLAALTCYFLAFDSENPDRFRYAIRPLGGPRALAGIRNVYGDSNAIYRTSALRAIGGTDTERSPANEDWEVFLKLVNAGYKIGVVPEHLFYYRHRELSRSNRSEWFVNHQRVLRQFANVQNLSPADSLALWTALLGFHQGLEEYAQVVPSRRQQLIERVVKKPLKWMTRQLGLM
jgi:D-glycero-alpha-D-manno-heptose 1-phosphate guanylyltransferase